MKTLLMERTLDEDVVDGKVGSGRRLEEGLIRTSVGRDDDSDEVAGR